MLTGALWACGGTSESNPTSPQQDAATQPERDSSTSTVDGSLGNDAMTDTAAPTFSQLRVLTYNVRHNVDYWKPRFDMIAEQLNALRPHIFSAQEVEIGDDQTQALFTRLAQYDNPLQYHVYEHLKTDGYEQYGEGIAIYSLFPFEETAMLPIGSGRIALFARIPLPNGRVVDVYNTHLHYSADDAYRAEQMKQILQWIEERSTGRDVLFLGDLNAKPDSQTFALTKERFVDAFAEAHPDEEGLTFALTLSLDNPTHNLNRRIDYVLYDFVADSPWHHEQTSLVFDQGSPGGLMPSDHLGVSTDFIVRP